MANITGKGRNQVQIVAVSLDDLINQERRMDLVQRPRDGKFIRTAANISPNLIFKR